MRWGLWRHATYLFERESTMVRIIRADERARTTVTVDGGLSGENVEPVEVCCLEALSDGKSVRLHLRDVTVIDERGRTMLSHLAAEGVDLMANGLYSSYIVDEIRSADRRKRRGS